MAGRRREGSARDPQGPRPAAARLVFSLPENRLPPAHVEEQGDALWTKSLLCAGAPIEEPPRGAEARPRSGQGWRSKPLNGPFRQAGTSDPMAISSVLAGKAPAKGPSLKKQMPWVMADRLPDCFIFKPDSKWSGPSLERDFTVDS